MEGSKKTWGTDTYAKWEKFEDGVDDGCTDASVNKGVASMQFNLGNMSFDVDQTARFQVDDESKAKRLRNLKQDSNEVWQVIVRKLRVWSAASTGAAEGEQAVPCRPYCILVSQLYPEGKLLSQHVCEPPESFPSPEQVFKEVVATMLNPLFGEQRKPRFLTLVDGPLAGKLYNSLKDFSVEVSQLSEAEGVDAVIAKFSEQMLKHNIASVGPTSEQPGRLSEPGVSVRLMSAIHSTAAKFAAAEPWGRIRERQAFQVELADTGVALAPVADESGARCAAIQNRRVWVSCLGHDLHRAKKAQGRQASNGAFGVAVFFSRLDLEARMVPPGETLFSKPLSAQSATERCSYSGKSAQELGHELKKTKPRKVDVRSGKELMYADGEALKQHWPSVRKFAIELEELERGRASRREYWLGIECTLLFEDATFLPFDDLDAIDKNNLQVAEAGTSDLGRCVYPLFLQFKHGQPERPTVEQLVWLDWAMNIILDLEKSGAAASASLADLAVELDSASVDAKVAFKISASPVYFDSEVRAAQEKRNKEPVQSKVDGDVEEEGQHEPMGSVEAKDPAPGGSDAESQGGDDDEEDEETQATRGEPGPAESRGGCNLQ